MNIKRGRYQSFKTQEKCEHGCSTCNCEQESGLNSQLSRLEQERLKRAHKQTKDGIVINGKKISVDELLSILLEHYAPQVEEVTCERCGATYVENNLIDAKTTNLATSNHSYVKGIQLIGTEGMGRNIYLCDHCIEELFGWLGNKPENRSRIFEFAVENAQDLFNKVDFQGLKNTILSKHKR